MPNKQSQIMIQSDFDGTLTVGDVSFQILDEFTGTSWRTLLDDYMQGKMSVNRFNSAVFSRVKTDREILDRFVRENAVIRPGFIELLDVCRERNFRFFIVSNGMTFYIDNILKMMGVQNIEFAAAHAIFRPEGVESWYEGPDGQKVEEGFKESYTGRFIQEGYRVVYLGNGESDFAPASMCSHIFSIDNLTKCCQRAGVAHTPFIDLHDIARGLKLLS
ncbi:MAG: HAD-IB family phosphatase [Dehalococcoidia bacterium]|nr:HAD-IB family phosphatase [Dehalococcoidia bacterium]